MNDLKSGTGTASHNGTPAAPPSDDTLVVNLSTDGAADADGENGAVAQSRSDQTAKRGVQFWAIIISLCIVGLLGALENTVVTTSLSTIVSDLGIGDNYIWITNIFFLTRYSPSPCVLWSSCCNELSS